MAFSAIKDYDNIICLFQTLYKLYYCSSKRGCHFGLNAQSEQVKTLNVTHFLLCRKCGHSSDMQD